MLPVLSESCSEVYAKLLGNWTALQRHQVLKNTFENFHLIPINEKLPKHHILYFDQMNLKNINYISIKLRNKELPN